TIGVIRRNCREKRLRMTRSAVCKLGVMVPLGVKQAFHLRSSGKKPDVYIKIHNGDGGTKKDSLQHTNVLSYCSADQKPDTQEYPPLSSLLCICVCFGSDSCVPVGTPRGCEEIMSVSSNAAAPGGRPEQSINNKEEEEKEKKKKKKEEEEEEEEEEKKKKEKEGEEEEKDEEEEEEEKQQ
ncbi:hypothetical protein STEG23_023956, partial [Scotinomys teguina]